MDYKDIELIYEEQDPAPAIVGAISRVAGTILSSILTGAIEAGKTALTEAAKLATLERLSSVLTEHLREMAGTWVSKTMIDASQSEWLGSLMHAIGLDVTDLGVVMNTSLDKGFIRFEEVFLQGMNQAGFQNDAIAGVWKLSFNEHKAATRDAILQGSGITSAAIEDLNHSWKKSNENMIRFETLNANEQEQLTRAELHAIFDDTEEKIKAREAIGRKSSLGATGSWAAERLENDLPGIIKTLGKTIDPFKEFLIDQTDTFTRSLMSLFTARIPVTPESANANGVTAFGMATAFGALAHGISAACEVLNPLSEMGFNYIAAYLVDIASFGTIARSTWGKYIKYSLDVPNDYYVQRQLRPTVPDPITLQMMAVKPDIHMNDFRLGMSYYGFSEEWINAIQKTMFKEPRYFELSMMLEDATADMDWLYNKCRRAAYNPRDAEILANGLIIKVLRPYLQAYRLSLTKLQSAGFITDEQFDANLEPLLLRSEANALLKKSGRFEYIFSYTNEAIALFKDQFDKDLIDVDDFELALSALGIRDSRIRLIIDRAVAKKTARVAKAETAEEKSLIRKQQTLTIKLYTYAFRQGRISSLELRRYLLAADIDETIVDLTISLEVEKRIEAEKKTEMLSVASETAKVNKQYEAGYIDLFRKDVIDTAALEKYLLDLDLEPAYVTATVEREIIRKIQPGEFLSS